MIIIGYQGIGKSTLANAENKCIDLESGNFWIDGQRAENWFIPYCQIANHLSEQGYTVFTSSHEVIRKELEKSKEKIVVIYPSINIKDEWLDKLKKRYFETHLEKDYKAYMNAQDRYTENITELMNCPFIHCSLNNINYDLKNIIEVLRGE